MCVVVIFRDSMPLRLPKHVLLALCQHCLPVWPGVCSSPLECISATTALKVDHCEGPPMMESHIQFGFAHNLAWTVFCPALYISPYNLWTTVNIPPKWADLCDRWLLRPTSLDSQSGCKNNTKFINLLPRTVIFLASTHPNLIFISIWERPDS